MKKTAHTFRHSISGTSSLGRIISALLIVALGSIPFTAAAKPPAGVKLAEEQVIHRGNGAEADSLDPQISESTNASNIQRDLFESLVSEAPDGRLIPGVAKNWDISEDRRQYTFHLRENAKWSNGDPVTAHDFVFSWRRLVDPATGSRYSMMIAPVTNAEAVIAGEMPPESLAVAALDDHTFQVNLDAPTPYFLSMLTHSSVYPVHPPSVQKFGRDFTRPGNLISNGAYVLDEWRVQSHIKLVRNPQYWDNENTTIDEAYYYVTEDMNAEVLRYRAGGLDMTQENLPVSMLDWIRENLPEELVISPWLGIYYYGFNMTQPPFKDNPKLRKALSMSIDREIITDKVLDNGVIPAYGFVPPGVLDYEGYEYPWKDMSREERLAEARRLYREAGYSEENPLRVELRYNTEQNHKKIALAIAAMWKQNLGVLTEIINQEWKVFLNVRAEKRITQAFRIGWIGDYNDAYTFLELGLSNNGQNDTGYADPSYDKLLKDSFNTGSVEERAAMLRQAEEQFLGSYGVAPIYYYVTSRLIKPYVGGYQSNIMNHHYTKNLYIKAH
ncbi:peptide ABC transporter substrate-binding protein [Proteobacteria bacterium 005FR1]|nr:peptide ABC transporter substrate-binding protein [Proteobacteria bacterium 005FR1]